MSAKREVWVIEENVGPLEDWKFFMCYDKHSDALNRMRDAIDDGYAEPERVRMVRYVPEAGSK
jgi:hypothetical protein